MPVTPATPGPYLESTDTEDLGRMVLSLLSELWITRDRLATLEAVLEQQGVLLQGSVENFAWTPETEPALEALRDRMVAEVMGAPLAARDRRYEAILERAGLRPRA